MDFVRSENNVSDIATKNVTGDVQDNHLEKCTMDKVSLDAPTQNRKGVRECVLRGTETSTTGTSVTGTSTVPN